jgi:acyltransferase 3
MMKNDNIFLKGLNELRAIAALGVLVHHVELLKSSDREALLNDTYSFADNKYFYDFIHSLGKNSVFFFFVLSGFLITHLIVREKRKFGVFDFQKFYMRRVLRIWPLYYIIMGISFLIIPFISFYFGIFDTFPNTYYRMVLATDYDSPKTILSYLGFLSNYGLSEGIVLVGGSQTWSVSIEEQFYLFWPVLLLLVFKRRPYLWLSSCIILIFILNYFFKVNFFSAFRYEYLFIGCMGGLFINSSYFEKIKTIIDKKIFYLINIFIILILSFFPFFSRYTHSFIISIFFLSFIILTVNNRFYFRSKIFDKMGKISYGIYMYHPFVMFLVFPLLEYLKTLVFPINMVSLFILQYILTIGITIFISYFSYNYIEKKFLTLKEKKYSRL